MSGATVKYCPMCKTEKPLEEFFKSNRTKDRLFSICILCKRESNRKYTTTEKGIATTRRNHLRRSYGIDLKAYESLLQAQGGKCKICGAGSNPDSRAGYFTVDHSHATGEVRGLLCTKCNALLGLAQDEEDILQRAIDYLKSSKIKTSTAIKITLQQ